MHSTTLTIVITLVAFAYAVSMRVLAIVTTHRQADRSR